MNRKIALCLIAVAGGYVLLQKPNCNRGCKTIAEHLMTDGLDGVMSGLLG
jgi:hypothetical protein